MITSSHVYEFLLHIRDDSSHSGIITVFQMSWTHSEPHYTHIMKIAAIKNANAIWEYNLELPGNWVVGGSLDVVVAIRTLAVKVRA